MLEAINTWSDYRTTVREFDAVLEHGKALSTVWATASPVTPQSSYGAQIFVKLLGQCMALRRLAPDPMQPMPRGLLDLPSMSMAARGVIEAHDVFEYVAGHAISASERTFRIRLWELNDAMRRLKILALLGSPDPAILGIRADAARLQLALEGHEYLATRPAAEQAEFRLRLHRSDPPEFHLTRRQRCELSGVNAAWHKAALLQLSQLAQTLPFSVNQLLHFEPGSPEALRLLGQPFVLVLPLLARVTQAATSLMSANAPTPPSRTARTMQAWRELAEGQRAGR